MDGITFSKYFNSKRLVLSGLLVLFLGNVFAQDIKVFTPNQEEYLSEITKFLESSDKKRASEFLEKKFVPFWNSTLVTDKQRQDVYNISNIMLKRRMNAFPDFYSFLNTAAALEKSSQSSASYDAWSKSVYVLLEKKRFQLVDFLNACSDLFETNTIFNSPTTKWVASRDSFEFVYDSIPKVVFHNMDITCHAKRDSSKIYGTRGVFLPLSLTWVGEGGTVTWERAGLDVNETYAELFDYEIKMKKSEFIVDSVLFHNGFFMDPLLGRLTDKILANVTPEKARYPLFESYDQRLEIFNLFKGVDYDGGFTMRGPKLIGSGTIDNPAIVTIHREDQPFLVSTSQVYIIEPNKLTSSAASVAFYLSEDSITHPKLTLKYIDDKKMLTLVRDEEGLSKTPFYNTFHNLDLYFEALYWKIDEPSIELGNLFGSSNLKAAFESKDYYNERRYYAIQGADPINPLVRVRDLTKKLGSYSFELNDFVKHTRLPKAVSQKMLIMLTNQGFLTYDLDRDVITVRKKLEDYVMNRAGKNDYDAILFNSRVDKGQNASINLVNYDMLLKGVSRITLSDSQDVKIYPKRKEVLVKEDRRLLFDGIINAGNLEFFAQGNDFDYEEFRIDMNTIDSLRMKVDSFDKNKDGETRKVRLKNVIEGLSGTIYIDQKSNKSGLKTDEFPEYPIFESTQESYVYYDKKSIQDGVYEREDFYYQLDPFILDSLDNFNANNIELEGVLVSDGIFPDIVKPLKVQQDYALGFEVGTGEEGLIAYSGVAKFTSTVSLNSNGLQGDGTLDFLTSTSTSEQFVFLPDSTIGTTTSFVNRERKTAVEVPEAHGDELSLMFNPTEEYLRMSTIRDTISGFNDQASLMGDLYLRKSGMTGVGLMNVENAEITSNLFQYNSNDFHADTASFNLQGQSDVGFAFKTDLVSADVDFSERKAEFKAINEASFVEFPENQYVCYMDKFTWFMDDNDMELGYDGKVSSDFVIDTDLDLTKSNFYSVRPDQDSLQFMAPGALYDIDKSIITCKRVDHIRVADARIMPDSGLVIIHKKAKMQPLINAEIKTNFITEYHTIYDADVKITSRNNYEGQGSYTYKDENDAEFIIMLDAISVDSDIQTIATGAISKEDEFSLSPAFQYYGDILLNANDKDLTFRGYTRIIHDCELTRDWMNFRAQVDPNEIYIPIDSNLTDDSGSLLSAGVLMGGIPVDLYSTFLSVANDDRDNHVLKTYGYLHFNKKENAYQITTLEKHKERSLPGDFVSIDLFTCTLSGEGSLDFGVSLGQLDFEPIGTMKNNTDTEVYEFQTSIPINFPMNPEVLEKMQLKMASYPGLSPVRIENTYYENSLRNLMGLEKADKIISDLTLTGKIKKMPDELVKSIYIADAKFIWNREEEAFVSTGKIGIATVGKKEVFSYVDGNILVEKRKGGDILTMYLELDEDNWYYFSYARTVMQVFSSDKLLNADILNTKEKDRKFAGGKKVEDYSYMLGSLKKKEHFLQKLQDM